MCTTQTSLAWGSHVPLLRAVVRHLPCQTVLECGGGDYSTPVLLNASRSLWTLEHDPQWAEHLRQKHAGDERFQLLLVPLPMGLCDALAQLTPEQLAKTERAYRAASRVLPQEVDLLLVDTFSGARLTALEWLAPRAKTILLHDTEPPFFSFYGYDRYRPKVRPRSWFSFQPSGHPHTDLVTNVEFDREAFLADLVRESRDFFGPDSEIVFGARVSHESLPVA